MLNTINMGLSSFTETTNITLSSRLRKVLSLDTPFTNGSYSKHLSTSNQSFHKIYSESIQADSSKNEETNII